MTIQDVTVALSGGVDSAVAAWLLCEQGHTVRAIFMKNWEEDDSVSYCGAAEDLADAERVCERLGIPLRTVNFASEYWDRVFTPFLAEHQRGRTPNPDVLCNREIKFDVFLDFALSLGTTRLATGHYARIERGEAGLKLLKGRDPAKDQSYFLHTLGQAQLERVEFPLGALDKRTVRSLARRAGLPVSDKKDSTGICFIGERPFKAFLSRFVAPCPGPMESTHGVRLGTHDGLAYYTLGQRRGLGIGGRHGCSGEPWYVAGKDGKRNALIVAQGRRDPALRSRRVDVEGPHWVRGARPALPLRCRAKTRYRQPEQPCVVEETAPGHLRVTFDEPQWAPTPGQSTVLYADDECLGGGIIERVQHTSGSGACG